jgi:hypothetical protein
MIAASSSLKGGVFMPKIIPIEDLKKTRELSELCRNAKEPIFVVKNGYPMFNKSKKNIQ